MFSVNAKVNFRKAYLYNLLEHILGAPLPELIIQQGWDGSQEFPVTLADTDAADRDEQKALVCKSTRNPGLKNMDPWSLQEMQENGLQEWVKS